MNEYLSTVPSNELKLTSDDKRTIGAMQLSRLFSGLVRFSLYAAVLFWMLVVVEPYGITVDTAGKLLSIFMLAYLEIWPEWEQVKSPERSEVGYVWKMSDNGWTPLYKYPMKKRECIGFSKENAIVLWEFGRYCSVNAGNGD